MNAETQKSQKLLILLIVVFCVIGLGSWYLLRPEIDHHEIAVLFMTSVVNEDFETAFGTLMEYKQEAYLDSEGFESLFDHQNPEPVQWKFTQTPRTITGLEPTQIEDMEEVYGIYIGILSDNEGRSYRFQLTVDRERFENLEQNQVVDFVSIFIDEGEN